jgi:hypothetical protein
VADDIFTIPTEIVARLRFESARCKAWNARWGEILTDFYAEAADEIERVRQERNYYKEMASHIAGKNFDANEEIHRLKIELKAVRGE